ncbi:VanZ family protein [uncultured Algibacter sp.]|uniref:VanZ family protein n=1 Tax=uncultured Algibacter sp. TaxID=298659 RepID=UPI002614A8EB|nr:VanZ family protein [uncultured Algibacter sp.]
MLRKGAFLAAVGYSIILVTISLITLHDLPNVKISFADKIFHFLAYGVFVILWYLAFFYTFSLKKKKAIVYAFVFAVIFGIVVEILQGTLTVSRALDTYDALANTLGALIASFVLWIKNVLHVKNS